MRPEGGSGRTSVSGVLENGAGRKGLYAQQEAPGGAQPGGPLLRQGGAASAGDGADERRALLGGRDLDPKPRVAEEPEADRAGGVEPGQHAAHVGQRPERAGGLPWLAAL